MVKLASLQQGVVALLAQAVGSYAEGAAPLSSTSTILSSPALVHRLHHDVIGQTLRNVLQPPQSKLNDGVGHGNRGNDGSGSGRQLQTTTEQCPGTPLMWKITRDADNKHVGFGVGTMHLPHDVVTTPKALDSILEAIKDSCDIYGELNFFDDNVTADFKECSGSFIDNAATVNDIPDETLKEVVFTKLTQVMLSLIEAGGVDADPDNAGTFAERLGDLPLSSVQMMIAYANTPEYFEKYNSTIYFGNGPMLDTNMLALGRPADDLEDVKTQCDIIPMLYPSPEDLTSNFDALKPAIEASMTTSLSKEIELYKCGNVDAFVQAAQDGVMAMDEMTGDNILTVRNQNMAERIDAILQAEQGDQRAMFAVGIAHWIIGDESLEVLLKEKGYTLERVTEWSAEDAEDHTNDHCGVILHPELGLFVEDHGIPAKSPTGSTVTGEPTHNVVKDTYFTKPPTANNSTEIINDLNTGEGLVGAPTRSPTKMPEATAPTSPSPPATSPSGSNMIGASNTMVLAGGFMYLLSWCN